MAKIHDRTLLQACIVFVHISAVAAQILPQYARNLTVFHVNPASAGAVPVNMDTGDARGDLYFYLGQFFLPLECANGAKSGRAQFDCKNPEHVDPDLVVTKVDLEIDSRTETYSACNYCNGTDPFSGRPCKKDTYICNCESSSGCDNTKVGEQNVTEKFVKHPMTASCGKSLRSKCGWLKGMGKLCEACIRLRRSSLQNSTCDWPDYFHFCGAKSPWDTCSATGPDWGCWATNVPRKTGGFWYSTLEEGMCSASSSLGSCGWKVLSTTTIKEKCLKNKLILSVEEKDPDCFRACGHRNTTSSCWISCFFDNVLGPGARHNDTKPLGGIPVEQLEKYWNAAFMPEKHGGCPQVDIPRFSVSASVTVV